MCAFPSAHFNAHKHFANTMYVFQKYDVSVGEATLKQVNQVKLLVSRFIHNHSLKG